MTSQPDAGAETPVPAQAAPDDGDSAASPDGPPVPARWWTRRRVLLTVVGVVVVLVLAAAWLAFRVAQAGRALTAAQDDLETISQEARDGDLSAVQAALPGARDHLHEARQAVDDPVWRAATIVPWAGRQLGAVRTVTVALDDVVTAAGPVLDAVDGMLGSPGGGLDLAPLVAAAPDVQVAAQRAASGARAVAALDADGLVPQLRGQVRRLQDEFAGLGPAADTVSHVAAALPGLLGGDGERTYLLVSLNNAELRAQGGIVGALALLRVDGTTVHLENQQSTFAFPGRDAPVLPLTAEEEELFGDRLGRWVQDAELTPDFPRGAELLAARWAQDTGQQPDGVIATDVVAVANLLRATGPVTTPSGVTIDADDAVQVLLNDTYLQMDEDQADTFFAEVAGTLLGAVTGGDTDAKALVSGLVDTAGQGRVHIWSAHEDEQAQLAATDIGGAFLSGVAPDAVGVFLDNTNSGKLDYYLTTSVTVEDVDCSTDEPTATVRLDLDYQPPANVRDLPWLILGTVPPGTSRGSIGLNVSVYAPVGAQLGALGYGDGQYVSGTTGTISGRAVQRVTALLEPGESATYRAQVPMTGGRIQVWSTPTLTSGGLLTASCSG